MIGNPPQEYLVNYGKSGELARFACDNLTSYQRGDRVIIQTNRGQELGTVLCPSTWRQQRLLHNTSVGQLLRQATDEDEKTYSERQNLGQALWQAARRQAGAENFPVEILDVEMLLDGQTALIQFLAWEEAPCDELWSTLSQSFHVRIVLENLSQIPPVPESEESSCGSDNCGQGKGGCGDCSSGGCSSCGRKGDTNWQEYFAHLRTRMENRPQRVELL